MEYAASRYTEATLIKALEEKNDMESRGRIENVQELKSNILGFLEQQPEDATLSGFLNEIALYTDLDSVEASDDCVTMMTIHSAKGLEFPVVYVVGMEEGIFPGASAQYDQEELEEERRLCYVAMTRAKEKLTLTNCRQRMLYGRTSANRASRFLEEIPEENMRWESKPEPRFGGMEHDGTFGGDRYEDGWGSSPARAGGAQQLRGFPAVLLGPVFKVDIVQKAHGGPVIGVLAAAKLVGIPAHHALHGQRVLDVKGLLIIGFEQREGLLAGQVALHGTFLLGSCALSALWLSYHPRPGRSSPHGFFAGMA